MVDILTSLTHCLKRLYKKYTMWSCLMGTHFLLHDNLSVYAFNYQVIKNLQCVSELHPTHNTPER